MNSRSEFQKNRSKVIIVGSGAAGIAAASRLFENDFTNITILEAENRIRGRILTEKMDEYLVDLGGQWVEGEVNNIVFDLAWPLGFLQKRSEYEDLNLKKIYDSSGSILSEDIVEKILNYRDEILNNIIDIENLKTGSIGKYLKTRFDKFINRIPEITSDQHQAIIYMINRSQMGEEGALDWNDVSAKSMRDFNNGANDDQICNWKDKGYSTILDILMKKVPDPKKEFPILKNTIFKTKVTKINYENDNKFIKVLTVDGREYQADHVIFTCSLGVLKAEFETMFTPALPERKINAIKNLGFGAVAKIYLLYEEPWWKPEDKFIKNFLWNQKDKLEIENSSDKRWMLGVYSIITIEHKPNLLCLWIIGKYAIEFEKIPEELFKSQTLELVNRFLGKHYVISPPKEIRRTFWNSNKNFRGTYSYRSIDSEIFEAKNKDLAEPIITNNKPIILFAGEATEPQVFSTVHGAISSGYREADRIINFYSNKIQY